METISIKDDNNIEYKFKTHGYTIKLYDVIGSIMYGAIQIDYSWYSCEWDVVTGESKLCTICDFDYGDYNLTPIKPKWYEDESNFPCLVRDNINPNDIKVIHDNNHNFNVYRPATKEECLSLVVDAQV